jgi:hypothetical protein
MAKGDHLELVSDRERRALGDYAEQTRLVLLAVLAQVKKLTVEGAREGKNFKTDEAVMSALTVTLSVRQVFTLLRVLGPIGLQNGDGSYSRLFAAMHVCQRHLLRAPNGKSLGVVAALQVLQVAINDQLWTCRDVHGPGFGFSAEPAPVRRGRPRKRLRGG